MVPHAPDGGEVLATNFFHEELQKPVQNPYSQGSVFPREAFLSFAHWFGMKNLFFQSRECRYHVGPNRGKFPHQQYLRQ